MKLVNQDLLSAYDLRLQEMQNALKGQDGKWVNILQVWRDELSGISDQSALRVHAARTARSMGGIESLGEVVQTGNDSNERRALEELYAVCRLIQSS